MISIVMPTYNRCYNLKSSYEAINRVFMAAGLSFELIVVDDGSCDQTRETLKALSGNYPNLSSIILDKNYGQQNATLAGVRRSKYPYVVTIDDDMCQDPKGILTMFEEILKGYDVVYGVYNQPHVKFYRNLGTWIKEIVFFALLKKPLKIRLTSYRIMTRKVADYISGDNNSKVYLSAKILQYTRNIQNLTFQKRLTEDSKYSFWKLMKLMTNILLYYTWVGHIVRFFCHKKQYEIEEIYE